MCTDPGNTLVKPETKLEKDEHDNHYCGKCKLGFTCAGNEAEGLSCHCDKLNWPQGWVCPQERVKEIISKSKEPKRPLMDTSLHREEKGGCWCDHVYELLSKPKPGDPDRH